MNTSLFLSTTRRYHGIYVQESSRLQPDVLGGTVVVEFEIVDKRPKYTIHEEGNYLVMVSVLLSFIHENTH